MKKEKASFSLKIAVIFLLVICTFLPSISTPALANEGRMTTFPHGSVEEEQTAPSSVKKNVRLLFIGNSFSKNAAKYLSILLRSAGAEKVKIGVLNLPHYTLKQHREAAEKDLSIYNYKKFNGLKITNQKNVSIKQALGDEKWDFISLQQASAWVGVEKSYKNNLDDLIKYIVKNKPTNSTKLCWHLTWALSSSSKEKLFEKYGFDQMNMYNAIIRVAKSQIAPRKEFAFIVPVGTAIQNLRTSFLGDNLTSDGRHLNELGCYTAGLMFVKSLGFQTNKITVIPQGSNIKKEYLPAIKEAVNNAFKAPFSVTQSKKKCNHNSSSAFGTVAVLPAVKATCAKPGLTEGAFCKVCGKTLKAQKSTVAAHKAKSFSVVSKATFTAAGVKRGVCTVCGAVFEKATPKIANASLSAKQFKYNGKNRTPKVTVTDKTSAKLKNGIDYIVTYPPKSREPGSYSVKITFRGAYKGSKVLKFKILKAA